MTSWTRRLSTGHGSDLVSHHMRNLEHLLGLPGGQADCPDERAGRSAADGQCPAVPAPGPARGGRVCEPGRDQPGAATGRPESGLAGGDDRPARWGRSRLAPAALPRSTPASPAAGVRGQAAGTFIGLSALLLASMTSAAAGRGRAHRTRPGLLPVLPADRPALPRLRPDAGLRLPGPRTLGRIAALAPRRLAGLRVCLPLWLRAGVTLASGVPFPPLSPKARGRLSFAGAAGLLLVGIARIAWLTAHHQVF